MKILKSIVTIQMLVILVLSVKVHAQQSDGTIFRLTDRIRTAPDSIFLKFRNAGMEPADHILTQIEKDKVEKAFAMLPPKHRKILERHLHSISFMDNMPNTALTSNIHASGPVKMFNITFRAEVLHQTISDWATWKEKTCYDFSANKEYDIRIEAGKLDAFLYIFLHEATHVVDGVLNITPHPDDAKALVEPTVFTKDVWVAMNVPIAQFTNPWLESTRFRGGKPIPIVSAPEVYKALGRTPFVSLYGTAAWFEDLAEIVTIYHLTEELHQPFRISILENGREIFGFEPMKGCHVRKRIRQLRQFYK